MTINKAIITKYRIIALIIEVFSGLGRFETEEEVIYISKDFETKPTICADVRFIPLIPKLKPRILHGSPPCRFISRAREATLGINLKGIALTFELWASFWKLADYLEPENITIESPQNIEKFLGKKVKFTHDKFDLKNCTTNLYLTKKSMQRAILAPAVRETILTL